MLMTIGRNGMNQELLMEQNLMDQHGNVSPFLS